MAGLSRAPGRSVRRQPARKGRRSGSGRLTALGAAVAVAFWRFCRPRSVDDALVLILASLGIASAAVGVFLSWTGGQLLSLPLVWGILLALAAAIVKSRKVWSSVAWKPSVDRIRLGIGLLAVMIFLVVTTTGVVGSALGRGPLPFPGELGDPWLVFPVLVVLALTGLVALLGPSRSRRFWALTGGRGASFPSMPQMTRVMRSARIDRASGSLLESESPFQPLKSSPIVGEDAEAAQRKTQRLLPRARSSAVTAAGNLPPLELFQTAPKGPAAPMDLEAKSRTIEAKLATFGVGVRVVGHHRGPTVTLFDVEPDPGVKVKRITELQNDLALALAAPTVRIQAPVPGRPVVGVEIPNTVSTLVSMREVLESEAYKRMESPLRVVLGKDVAGESVCIDLAAMPHLLIAGATGSGKSVMLNVIITSLLYQSPPDETRILMIDPKMVELTVYNGIPHLYSPVVTEMDKVLGVMRWTLREMERRFTLFRDAGVRNISRYNHLLLERGERKLPYIVLIVDELADLMMVAPDEVEGSICRLAQLARATGIHLVIATQRPSVDVITGLIKANFPARIAFAMSSQVDSRTILDQVGAEKLLGRGDMLYQSPTEAKPVRLQGALVSDQEIERVVEFWRTAALPSDQVQPEEFAARAADGSDSQDPLLDQATAVVREHNRASVSLLQRKLSIGYQRAARLLDTLEGQGVVTSQGGRFRAVNSDDVDTDENVMGVP
jgi:DNA segregation ATPase FtsK/SpoIIIE-like protein